ncbi:hypothetical protein V7122_02610 [Bacillus sp. JJ1532]|uniref:hypothetical protein n=1 Tax=unclassified Bacillus (in: firmicutes) TaxID=185979 RepID=UPI002FFF3280
MKLDELVNKINQCVDEFDYVSARKYIEENIGVLEGRMQLLKGNARVILNFLIEQLNSGVEPLSRKELTVINAINAYAYKFDLRGIKVMLKENAKLFLREDIIVYLNSDAKIILTGMKVINN